MRIYCSRISPKNNNLRLKTTIEIRSYPIRHPAPARKPTFFRISREQMTSWIICKDSVSACAS